ncbi:MAG: segregation/condensation protein A [Eubacteriales bacterium]|nr:segregation/condensation protein A [Eubacteriales bacterium]
METIDQIEIKAYDSPLELLDQLIRVRKADLFDLPIAELCRHYLEILEESSRQGLDMNLASEFIVMAATLMEIKTRMLLPEALESTGGEDDPRRDLVLQLMAYRRMKALATDLEERYQRFGPVPERASLKPSDLGLPDQKVGASTDLDPERLWQSAERISSQNEERYNPQSRTIRRLLKREQWSVKDKIKEIWRRFKSSSKFLFSELFASKNPSKGERISTFLAILEMAQQHELKVEQKQAFGEISLEKYDGD